MTMHMHTRRKLKLPMQKKKTMLLKSTTKTNAIQRLIHIAIRLRTVLARSRIPISDDEDCGEETPTEAHNELEEDSEHADDDAYA